MEERLTKGQLRKVLFATMICLILYVLLLADNTGSFLWWLLAITGGLTILLGFGILLGYWIGVSSND